MIQKKNSVLIRKKRMRIEGDRKNHEITRGCAMKRSQAMFSYFCWKSKKTNLFASSEGCTNFCPPKNKNVPQKFSQGDKLSPSDQILAQTLAAIHRSIHLQIYWSSDVPINRPTDPEIYRSTHLPIYRTIGLQINRYSHLLTHPTTNPFITQAIYRSIHLQISCSSDLQIHLSSDL